MPLDQFLSVGRGHQVTVDRPFVDLGQGVVKAFAVTERLVDGRIEAVQEPQFELIGALEEVLQLRE